MAYKRLGDLLIDSGAISQEDLERALELKKGTNERLGYVLVENGIVSEQQLIDALRMQLGIEFVDLSEVSLPVELAQFVPRNIAARYRVVPVKLQKDVLYIAMADPLDFTAQEEVKKTSHKEVVPMIATERGVERAIGALYGNEGTARAMEEMKREQGDVSRDIIPAQMESGGETEELSAPTIRFVNSIIERAVEMRASDIHLEPGSEEMIIRMRIDGDLRRMLSVPKGLQSNVISRLKIMGGMDISEHGTPLDGHYMSTVKGHRIDLRLSSIPTIFGEKMVIRILDKTTGLVNSAGLGMTEKDFADYRRLLANSYGAILIVGPTGSGKSTTMASMLTDLCTERVNITTLEDPVEYDLPGVSQCQINEKTGFTFADGLRAILRQDPDIISIGEIRDGETGRIAMRSAIVGHLVLSTLHTNDAVGAVHRLEDIGVETYLVSSSLKGVISQRLVKKICPHCKKAYAPDAEEKKALGINPDEDVTFYRGEGCSECHHLGTLGRQAVFEIMVVNSELKAMIERRASEDEMRKAAIKGGMVTLSEACKRLVLDGVISCDEAVRTVNSTVD